MAGLVMYTLPFCPYCFSAKKFLNSHNIPFEERKVVNPSHLKEMRGITASLRVPIIKVGDKVLAGYKRKEYEEAFASFIKK